MSQQRANNKNFTFFPAIDQRIGSAQVIAAGDTLLMSSGLIQRTLRLTSFGLLTTRVINVSNGQEWARNSDAESAEFLADWSLPLADKLHPHNVYASSDLLDFQVRISDDEGFTNEHIEVCATFAYPERRMEVRWVAWVWPDAPGMRTQLQVRKTAGFMPVANPEAAWVRAGMQRIDAVPCEGSASRRCIGFYGDTQNRNDADLDLMLERVYHHPLGSGHVCDWANICGAETDAGGIALVKESHKLINQFGHDSGVFRFDPDTGLHNLGWGVQANELTEFFQSAWASWCVVYGSGDLARQDALKLFDRTRYPIDPDRDAYVQANTWGSSYGRIEHREAAAETPVLRELDSCADLGIDVLQIDDGWQGDTYKSWTPIPERYPQGWGPVRQRASQLGVQLGLWAHCQHVSLEDLLRNNEQGGFVSYKLDFANLNSRQAIEQLMQRVRSLSKQSQHPLRINWDLTEITPRFGYYFAREYGQIYLENRKPLIPRTCVYRPHTVLRDLWQISTYLPLQKFQGSIQNKDMVDRVLSDAWQHPHDYCVAIALMSTPLFFQQTQFYDEGAREHIRPLLKVYKAHRQRLFASDISPIGNKPDNTQWTGFHARSQESEAGYLLIFRELHAVNDQHAISLPGLSHGADYAVEDLVNPQAGISASIVSGCLNLSIPSAPGFRFLRYQRI